MLSFNPINTVTEDIVCFYVQVSGTNVRLNQSGIYMCIEEEKNARLSTAYYIIVANLDACVQEGEKHA